MYTLTGYGLGSDGNEGGETILRNRLFGARFIYVRLLDEALTGFPKVSRGQPCLEMENLYFCLNQSCRALQKTADVELAHRSWAGRRLHALV